MPEQVQDFYPTPSTMATAMFYTGVDPRTMEPIYVARDPHEKAMQRALIQYRKPENYKLVREALERAGRQDLIGFDKHCLIRPFPPKGTAGKGRGAKAHRAPAPARGGKAGRAAGSAAGTRGRGPQTGGHRGPAGSAPAGRNRAAQGREGARGGRRR